MDRSVFGIELGKPLDPNIKECGMRKLPFRKNTFIYTDNIPELCFRRDFGDVNAYFPKPDGPIIDGAMYVVFPRNNVPEIVHAGILVVGVIGGSVEWVMFVTDGIEKTDDIMKVLTAKYKSPTMNITDEIQVRAGSKFPRLTARWLLPDLFITFQSVAADLNTGNVTISTKKGEDNLLAREQKLPSGPQL